MKARDVLVGSTGFVGSNLCASHEFDKSVHSTNVSTVFGESPDLLVYAGVPSAMFLANSNPGADLAIMKTARENIKRINPKKVVLISTIAVYGDSQQKSENDEPSSKNRPAYGSNRHQLEQWVLEDHQDVLVIRLPALYGKNLKKNFLFDLINITPQMLKNDIYASLARSSKLIEEGYARTSEDFWTLRPDADANELKNWFSHSEFNALSFTDSRSRFQFYSLFDLWTDIERALQNEWHTLNIATPPIAAGDVYEFIRGETWRNEIQANPFQYDIRSIHFPDAKGDASYMCTREQELLSIRAFVEKASK